jgi:Bacterial capsule synthesis protein PGA_cap
MRRWGWDHRDEFGWFMTAAVTVMALAALSLVVVHALVARYEWRRADGDFDRAAVAGPGQGVAVLGASIGEVPDAQSLADLRRALGAEAADLPWHRAFVRRAREAVPLSIESLFFAFNRLDDAMAFCRRLAAIAPDCTPVVAASWDLTTFDARAVDAPLLARLGITDYTGKSDARVVLVPSPPRTVIVHDAAPSPKIVYLPVPRAAGAPPAVVAPAGTNVQAPLQLQSGVGSGDARVPEDRIWLSATYHPGDPRLVDIVGAGDVMMGSFGTGLNPALTPGADAAALVGADLATIFRRADIAFVNLEGPLYEGSQGTPKDCAQCFAFHGPLFYAGILHSLGVDAVSLANNHSGDYGEAGRDSTMAALRSNGIVYGGLDRDDARAGEMVLPGGKRVALVAFAPNNGTLNINDLPRAAEIVRDLKKTHDLVMVSFHGGGEGWTYVHVAKGPETFVGENRGNVTAFAHTVIDAGADIVIGQGPHVPRAVEVYRGHLIAYSLGNFWTYSGVQTYAVSGMGPVLEAWVAPDGSIAGFVIHSTRQAGLGVPHLDPLGEASRYMMYLTRSDFPGTAALIDGHKTAAATATTHDGS